MSSLLYSIILQWKVDIRNKDILLTYYLVPILFYIFVGNVFTSVMPNIEETLTQSMVIFAILMGTSIGSPQPIADVFTTDIKKGYQVSNIPLGSVVLVNYISAFVHMLIVSCIIIFSAPLIFQTAIPTSLSFWIGLVLYIITSVFIGSCLGVLVKSSSKLTMISQVVFLPSMMLSGIMFPNNMLPDVFQTISKLFPATWGFELMCSKTILTTNIFILLIISLICYVVLCVQINRVKKI